MSDWGTVSALAKAFGSPSAPSVERGPGSNARWNQEIGMIGLVIVTHGGLATEFRAAMEHVVGVQTSLETISIGPDDDIEQRRQDILAAVQRVDSGAGVIILTDMFGGTPSNLAISTMNEATVEVIAGINLPMLIRLAQVRQNLSVVQAVDAAKEAGKKYINVASQVLNGH